MSNTRNTRIKQTRQTMNTGMHVETFTSGHPGDGFNVKMSSPAATRKQRSILSISVDDLTTLNLTGKQVATLYEVLNRHFSTFNRNNFYYGG